MRVGLRPFPAGPRRIRFQIAFKYYIDMGI